MNFAPEKQQQITQFHAPLIVTVFPMLGNQARIAPG